MNVFAKIFSQIFDSSIASDYVVRHVFMDLLVLADRDGVVDMTLDAISRRTNVPEEIVHHAITELCKPDRKSRSHEEQGCRLVPIDSHRDWGWQIVNYEHYRNIRDEEARRTYFRDKKREQRQKSPTLSNSVKDSQTFSTQEEGDTELDTEAKEQKPSPRKKPSAHSETLYKLYPRHVGKKKALAAIDKALREKSFDELLLAVQAFCRKCAREGKEEQFIPHPATWFAQGRYEDEEFKPGYQIQRQGASNGKGHSNLAALREALGPDSDGLDTDGDVEGSAGGRAHSQALFKETGE